MRALAIREKQLGAEHPDTATSLNNLAGLYQSQGKYPEAEPLYERALAISEQILGSKHPQTQRIRKNYASVKRIQINTCEIGCGYILIIFVFFIIWLFHRFDLLGWISLAFVILLIAPLAIATRRYFLRRV